MSSAFPAPADQNWEVPWECSGLLLSLPELKRLGPRAHHEVVLAV